MVLNLVLALLLIGQQPSPKSAPLVESARVAALRFVIDQGWELPKDKVILAEDTYFGAIDGHPVRQSAAEVAAETRAMQVLLGPKAGTGKAADFLRCPSPGVCFAKTDQFVVFVGGLFQGEHDVLIRVYAPGPDSKDRTSRSSTTTAIVDLAKQGAGWSAVGYSKKPTTTVRPR